MKLAFVNDSPRTGRRQEGPYIDAMVAAVQDKHGVDIEWQEFYTIDAQLPGGVTPSLMQVREGAPRLIKELSDWQPDAVMSWGKMALNALGDGSLKVLKREHGRMRWLELESGPVAWTPGVAPIHVVRNPDLHRDFERVLVKVVTQLAPLPEMPIELHVAKTVKEACEMVELLEGASVISVDVETGGLSAYADDLTTVGFGAYGYDEGPWGLAVVIPKPLLFEPDVLDAMYDTAWRISRRTVGHNFKFDMQFLERLVGWAPEEALIGDTLLLAHLLDERPTRMNARARGSGLKDLVAQRYDIDYGFDHFDTAYDDLEEEQVNDLWVYLGRDVAYTARLWHDMEKEANDESPNLMKAHDTLLAPAARAIARCELAGAPLDLHWVDGTVAVIERRIAKRTRVLEKAIQPLLVTVEVDNILSPTQIADVMYDDWNMTPDIRRRQKTARSTDKDHLEAAIAKYLGTAKDRQARWLRGLFKLRKDTKVLATYQKSLRDRVDADDRVRASFLLHGTSTGRLSSQGPNLQNVPAVKRTGADQVRPMRRAFAPTPGRAWCDVDYSQLELRVAAAVSGDEAMAEVFRSGRDVHMEIACAIFGKEPEDISPAQRFIAKSVSFGVIYGRSAKAIADGAEMDYAERQGMARWTELQAQQFIDRFLRSYPNLTAWIAKMHKECLENNYVESAFGRRRRFPLVTEREVGSIQRQAVNTPIQSAASDICLSALVEIQQALDGLDATVLFPVHDSICIECDESLVPRVEEICRMVMEKDWMGVPLTVDFSYGPDWATAGGWHE